MSDSPSDPESPPAVKYVHTAGLGELLERLGISLFVSTYQAGKLIVVRGHQGRVSTLLRSFERPMGLAIDAQRLVVGTKNQIWFFENVPAMAARLPSAARYDACYLPRRSHVTGDVRIHELDWCDQGERLCFVNTRFSCLCNLDSAFSFAPAWKPPFISQTTDEDRCHLNGLHVADGQPRLVTALGQSDQPGGWREDKTNGGCLIDVNENRVVADGLCMPHSPRMHDGRIFLLNSGRGELLSLRSDDQHVVARVPGYARGLSLVDRYAFIGVSKIRETSTFGGLPISQGNVELKCGMWVVDCQSGETVEYLEFTSGVEEIFDVRHAAVRFPAVIGFEKPEVDSMFVTP